MSGLTGEGVLVPLPTPFTDDLSNVSEVRLARLVRRLMEMRPLGFLVCPPLGEFQLLSQSERKHVLEIVQRETAGAVAVVAHVTAPATMTSLDLAQHARRHGAAATVAMPPPLGDYTDGELQAHFRTINNHADLPLWIMDPAERLGATLQESVLQHGGVKWIKDAEGPDTWSRDGIRVFPGAALGMAEVPPEVVAAFARHRPVRLIKAIWQARDLDLGPPRLPYQALPSHEVADLAAM